MKPICFDMLQSNIFWRKFNWKIEFFVPSAGHYNYLDKSLPPHITLIPYLAFYLHPPPAFALNLMNLFSKGLLSKHYLHENHWSWPIYDVFGKKHSRNTQYNHAFLSLFYCLNLMLKIPMFSMCKPNFARKCPKKNNNSYFYCITFLLINMSPSL